MPVPGSCRPPPRTCRWSTPCARTSSSFAIAWCAPPPAEREAVMHRERHRSEHIGWLRAAVLGANDGLISTSSLVVGVASAEPTRAAVLLAAVAGLAAGALSMAAGAYVS